MRVVQVSGPTDPAGGRVYGPTQIQAAINSCTGTSTSWCLIKLGPGTYDLGSGTLQLKPYTALQGSGIDVTTLVSDNTAISQTCTVGTVMMANSESNNESAISNITIQNKGSAAGGQYISTVAIVANSGDNKLPLRATLDHVRAVTGSDSTPGGRNDGFCVRGDFTTATVTDSILESHNSGPASNAFSYLGGALTVAHSTLISSNAGDPNNGCHLMNHDNSGGNPGVIKLSNVDGTASCTYLSAIRSDTSNLYIDNSKFVFTSTNPTYDLLDLSGPTEITNTRILSSGGAPLYLVPPGIVKIATSQLPGDTTALTTNGATLFQCYGPGFTAVP
jgi:hypothetical protein